MKLTRCEMELLRDVLGELHQLWNVRICDSIGWNEEGKVYRYSVNWSAQGAQKPEVAREYAKNILNASLLAEHLNDNDIMMSYGLDTIDTEEEYYKRLNHIIEGFKRVPEITVMYILDYIKSEF